MKKPKIPMKSTPRKTAKKSVQEFPPGWKERDVRAVIEHYDRLTDQELAREIALAPEVLGETLVSVPNALLPAVKKLIVLHQKGA
jgi:hypothetical protein